MAGKTEKVQKVNKMFIYEKSRLVYNGIVVTLTARIKVTKNRVVKGIFKKKRITILR